MTEADPKGAEAADTEAAATDSTGAASQVDDRYMVPGLVRGLSVLEAFTAEKPALTLNDLAKAIDLSRSSTYRLVYTLAELGFLQREGENKTYRLGSRVLRLGFAYLASQEVVEIARPHLAKLRDTTNCSAHLGILDGTDILYVARYADRKALTSRIQVGSRLPAHATSIGRAILSQFTAGEIRRRFQGVDMPRYSDVTPTDIEGLVTLLARDAARGYVLSHSAFEPGIASVAAPIFTEDGTVAGAINITTPEQTTEADILENTIKDAVLETADTISEWLGHRGQRRSA